jgi:glutathione peroxidase-family protein
VEFCEKNYGVTFPLADKVDVKGGTQSPIYQWLTKLIMPIPQREMDVNKQLVQNEGY